MTSHYSSTPLSGTRIQVKRIRIASNSCPKCEKVINDGNECIECGVCELIFCMECTNVSEALRQALKDDKSSNFKWTCNACKQNFPCMSGLNQKLRSIEDKTDSRLGILEAQVENLKLDMAAKITEEVQAMRQDINTDIIKEIKTSLQSDIRVELKEIEEQKQRAMNLILFNLQECPNQNKNERKKFDEDIFTEICQFIEVREVDIKVAFRLGNPGPHKSRPLKIILNNKKHRKDILDNAHKLKNVPPTSRVAKCIISKDLTVRQREENKKRRDERKKNNDRTKTEQAYNDQTVIQSKEKQQLSTKSQRFTTTAIIENVNQDMDISFANFLSQPILPGNGHRSCSTPMHIHSDLGEETITGGLYTGTNDPPPDITKKS